MLTAKHDQIPSLSRARIVRDEGMLASTRLVSFDTTKRTDQAPQSWRVRSRNRNTQVVVAQGPPSEERISGQADICRNLEAGVFGGIPALYDRFCVHGACFRPVFPTHAAAVGVTATQIAYLIDREPASSRKCVVEQMVLGQPLPRF